MCDPQRHRTSAGHRQLLVVCLALLLSVTGVAKQATPAVDNSVTAGELVVEPPTLINLGFEWPIEGDANGNAKVAVSYRKAGDSAWQVGMPLLRL